MSSTITITNPVYGSSVSAGGEERMLHSVTDGALASGTESSASDTETASSSGPAQPALMEQNRTANASTSSGGFGGFATETLFARSSKIPTSSFQNDLTSKLVSPSIRSSRGSSLCSAFICVVYKVLVHQYMQCHLQVHSGGCFHQRTQSQTPPGWGIVPEVKP